jgi:YVTN family beta-propeller protein
MKRKISIARLFCAVCAIHLVATGKAGAADYPVRQPGEEVNNPELRQRQGLHPNTNLLFNGWGVTPAGQHVLVSDLALKLVIAPDKKTVIATHGGYNDEGVSVIDLASRKARFFPLSEAWNGLVFGKDGHQFFVSGGDSGKLHVFKYANGVAAVDRDVRIDKSGERFLAGLAVDSHTGKIYVCDEARHEILVLDPVSLAIQAEIPVGLHPHTCVIGADQRHLYVSDWGSSSVSIVDMQSNQRVRDVTVGIRPNDMVLAPDGRLFVACAGDNTVHVIQTKSVEALDAAAGPTRRLSERAREIISTSLYPESPEGSTPDALAVSPDGRTLFVANADNNNVMVADISNEAVSDDGPGRGESISIIDGFIPVGWYPSALAVSSDNGALIVANGKGLMSRANFPPQVRKAIGAGIVFDHPAQTFQGAISFIPRPDAAQMAAYTAQVRRNSPYAPEQFQHAPVHSDSAIPDTVGAPCPIKYVLYIIKENRTYDQVFGDFKDAAGKPAGNGNPHITMYGENVTPNHHQLARDYVLMDNLYCNSEVSVDGHSWCDAAIATDFNQRSWILSYSRHGHLPGNDEMAVPSSGYLWDLCRRHGVTCKNYGEGAMRVPSANRGRWRGARDTARVKYWIEDLQAAEETGDLPRFTIMSLGEDHTRGTKPGEFTPFASVASNDRALGEIVEAASHSRFWNEMAIFVIEDDAQNGPDHVDAHRTVGLVISPYCKRGFIDSTLYTTASMVRTMELVLGLPPLTQYDAAATPMFNSFQNTAQNTPYQARPAQVDLMARNNLKSPGAKQSAKMNFRDYDLAPEDELNRILWLAAKGSDEPYPTPIHGAILSH